MTPSALRRQVAAVEAAAKLGPVTEQTAEAITRHLDFYSTQRALKKDGAVYAYAPDGTLVIRPKVDRRTAQVANLLTLGRIKADRRRFTGESMTDWSEL